MITVVDDDPSVRKSLRRLIKAAGYDSIAYESAEEFLAAPTGAESDCLILDVHLPGMSGLALQADLTQTGSKCPIVFISAFSDEDVRSQAIEAGATDFLPKPLDSDRLLRAIQRATTTGADD